MAYEDSPVIEFPEGMPIAQIVVIVNKLNIKMAVYKRRLQSNPNDVQSRYKLALVETLLSKGEVITQEVSERLEREFGNFNDSAFENACMVVNDYVETGGTNVKGGKF